MNRPLQVLLVEDNVQASSLLTRLITLVDPLVAVEETSSLAGCLDKLKEKSYSVVLLDLMLPDTGGLSGLKAIQDQYPELPVVVLTGTGEDYRWVAMEMGAQDYLNKGPEVTGPAVVRCLRHAVIRHEVRMKFRRAIAGQHDTETELRKAEQLSAEYSRRRVET